ncbi:hypothetical protein I302_102400 [Kwoniella bestiolae CBS 10118]|uniref:TOG domain-containing protein n=1 Tax=Kwoniella bestiolae CBS 10118 TaxID=1296100 RepID=A0A1B9GEY1_9TREE|nr:hypothetical protein I302_01091 [Kwoniella bestiolae CBS 10118]OCF29583.1 hypothetical protein I302_01091 [Kwoniella bestiolae CBS 10118]
MKVLTEEDVEGRIVKLRSAEPDKKVDIIQAFGLDIEEVTELPESTIDPLILLLPPLIRSSHPLLQSSTLSSFLPFFIPLIPDSPTSHLRLILLQILPALLEKLNDPKERIHSSASNVIFLTGKKCFIAEPPLANSSLGSSAHGPGSKGKEKEKETLSQTFERCLKDTLNSKSWRSKVESLKILSKLRGELGAKLGLKGWLGVLVDLLEDSDGNVREQAKETVVALLSPASTPPAARSELKKLLLARNVRKTISNDIIARVLGGGGGSGAESGRSTPANVLSSGIDTQREEVAVNGRSGTATPALSVGGAGDEVEIVYIASPHDLSNELAAMLPHFEGKETEQNWAPREKAVVRIRGMLRGGVWPKFSDAFIQGLKGGILEGVSRTIVSLRTTVAQQSCYLMKELAETLGPSFDPFVEHLLPILAKMAGYTKKIIAERSQACVTAIIIHTHIHPRVFITHIAAGVSDKNIQTRHFSTGHLKTFLDIHGAKSKHAIETTPGMMEQLEGAVKKSLADVNPAVRDLARQAFWSYHSVWRSRAEVILNSLDGMARKQLEKANPHDSNGIIVSAKAAPPARRATSTMSALLAEKRKAKAAELAAGKMAQESPRIVSGPVPGSPSMQQGMPRSNSSASLSGQASKPGQLERSITSPETPPHTIPLPSSPGPSSSPTPSQKITPRPTGKPALGSPKDLLSTTRDRPSSLGRSPPSRGSPSRDSPLRQSSTYPFSSSGLRSPASSTASSSAANNLRTPQSHRRPPPSFSAETGLGLGVNTPSGTGIGQSSVSHEAEGEVEDWAIGTPTRVLPPGSGVVEDARRAQAAQAESAAQQLMEYAEDEQEGIPSGLSLGHSHDVPTTPARPTNGNGSAYKTPLNVRKAWEDSPRPEAVTPLMMERLKERKHERSWWVRRQELMDKASPLKSTTPAPSSAITEDIEGLTSSQPTLRNLQKLALFSTSHPVHNDEGVDMEDQDLEEEKKVWNDDRVFERILQGLLNFLKPAQNKKLLEQGLVVLWEMVQHQWTLFDGHEHELLEALFGLRASHDATILESTNALISLLTQISDPMYFMTLLRSSLARFLSDHPSTSTLDAGQENLDGMSRLSLSGNAPSSEQERIRNSGWLFGLTSLGMCILRLPEAVVRVEGEKLGQVIMEGMSSPSSIIRQASQTLLLSIQTILKDSNKTLSFVDGLNKGQKDLAIYYMAQNGILDTSSNSANAPNDEAREDEGKEKMLKEMQGLMGRGISRNDI